ncbi:hypothetical protein CAPTEDRAFT_199323 [Capitella teleta]|uniref:Uncharacterized protein n=1 Tax=Capitella teleta TaxID=283909 RepID=R7VDC3_CAPTE|nr:hypothetical protein CAPTEDRAFT_199323 [Capitella teleta]|eukprot:ELU16838.1 hypothetical protein CAPTEDRAFT_199323 [Capitella teleta]
MGNLHNVMVIGCYKATDWLMRVATWNLESRREKMCHDWTTGESRLEHLASRPDVEVETHFGLVAWIANHTSAAPPMMWSNTDGASNTNSALKICSLRLAFGGSLCEVPVRYGSRLMVIITFSIVNWNQLRDICIGQVPENSEDSASSLDTRRKNSLDGPPASIPCSPEKCTSSF